MTPRPLAAQIVAELTRRGERVAVAESLTGGLLSSALVDVPGASAVIAGGVVAYATELKVRLLGVDAALVAERGPVDADVAAQMASGVRERLVVGGEMPTYGIATTGVAGPDPQDGQAPGTVWIGLADASTSGAELLQLRGNRDAVRAASVDEALKILARRLGLRE